MTTLVALAALVTLVACGIPEDGEPRAIAEDRIPEGLSPTPATATTLPIEDTEPVVVYLVGGGGDESPRGLVAITREVRRPATIERALRALLQGAEDERLTSSIPEAVELLRPPVLDDGTLTVDLSREMGEVEGEGQRLAFGQIVLTVTSFEEVRRVQFQIEGEDSSAPDGDGNSQRVVDATHYDSLLRRG